MVFCGERTDAGILGEFVTVVHGSGVVRKLWFDSACVESDSHRGKSGQQDGTLIAICGSSRNFDGNGAGGGKVNI